MLVAVLASAQVPTFQHDVLPLFEKRCISCHGSVKTAGLDMRTLEAIMKGGAGGTVVQPGKPDASFLWKKIASDAMPLGGTQLTPEEKPRPPLDRTRPVSGRKRPRKRLRARLTTGTAASGRIRNP